MKRKPRQQDELNKDYSGITELQDHETSLINYSTHIVNLVNNAIGDANQKGILEFGAGTGFLMEIFRSKFGREIEGCEIDPKLIKRIEEKGFDCHSDLSAIKKTYQTIYTSNVLEHIENDVEVLSDIKARLELNGKLIIYVPALPWLYSGLDSAVGHYRRYQADELQAKLTLVGFEVEQIRYVDVLGVPATLVTKILGYKNGLGIGSSLSMRIYDSLVFPFSRLLDSAGFKKIIGKNLFAVAVKR